MRRLPLAAPSLTFALLLSAHPALAQQQPQIAVETPWARATPGNLRSTAAYLSLTDHGLPDTLIGASTPIAGMAMIHESSEQGGVARMRMLDKVPLAPHQTVALKPGGLHIMLTGLKQALKPGDSFPLTLVFANAAPVTVTVPVVAAGAAGPAAASAHDMSDMKMPGMKMPGMKME